MTRHNDRIAMMVTPAQKAMPMVAKKTVIMMSSKGGGRRGGCGAVRAFLARSHPGGEKAPDCENRSMEILRGR